MPIHAEGLDECRFIDGEGNVLDLAETPFVLMPDPKARDTAGPCALRIVTRGRQGYFPTEVEIDGWEEADRACDAANAQMGWTPEEVDQIILPSMNGGTA